MPSRIKSQEFDPQVNIYKLPKAFTEKFEQVDPAAFTKLPQLNIVEALAAISLIALLLEIDEKLTSTKDENPPSKVANISGNSIPRCPFSGKVACKTCPMPSYGKFPA